jgi:four helix bundle protein
LTGPLLERPESSDLARQLRKAATSVSSTYRAAGRARSHKEFTAKIGVVREEADEALHWLALIRECSLAAG